MKKIIYTILSLTLFTSITSCKTEVKENQKETEKKEVINAAYSLKNATHKINWTAFKTTEKIPVNGEFQKVNITANGEGNTIKEAINNTSFSIPISSIFTKDTSRDFKIRKFFFGIMDKTELLSGNLILENDSIGHSNLTMNGVTKKLPFKYNIKEKTFSLSGTLKITNWEANNALDSLNNACKDLHKGADGISKTWDEVTLNISSTFK